MKDIGEYIKSGVIESYVLGLGTPEEIEEVESLVSVHPEIREAINAFSIELEETALANAIAPNPLVKPLLMATIDFIDRMENGETPSTPIELHAGSAIGDYAEWLNRPDFVLPQQVDGIYAKLISATPEMTTAIVWIKEMAPQEVHHDEYEKFLIVEGTCEIMIEEEVHSLVAGDYLAIPLYKNHIVKVTSDIPCKVILQRIAA